MMAANGTLRNNSRSNENVVRRVNKRMASIRRIIRKRASMNQLTECRNELLALYLNLRLNFRYMFY